MRFLLPAALVIVGIIHLLPLVGVLGADRLTSLYGVAFVEPDTVILMRHRAVLFGLLGGFLVYAAFRPPLRLAALIVGFISVVSFLYLAWAVGDYNDAIARVVAADLVALACLVAGGVAHALTRHRARAIVRS